MIKTLYITAFFSYLPQIANWVAESVLEREDSRKRAAIVKHFITVADVGPPIMPSITLLTLFIAVPEHAKLF